ncbi:phenylacetate--CoA ligase family protein [Nocardia rhamnosiphila]|uniref:AMP-binding protein n=1 Tax=Nocardia rhamnosiphila TaxID=426716 RepID=A0ABV2X273_9NOCA
MRNMYSAAERLTRDELEALQLRKLRNLLNYNYENNPFYRDLWKSYSVHPDDIQSLADYRHKVPMVSKRDFLADQDCQPPFGRRLGVDRRAVRQVHLTSGTSGIGQEAWGLTQADVESAATAWLQQYHWMGLTSGDVAFYSMPVSFFANGLSAEHAGRKMGMSCLNLFGMDKQLAFNLMERFQPQYLYGMMSMAAMASLAGPENLHGRLPREVFPTLKAIQGSAMSASTMQRVSEEWGAPIYEIYGCTQGGSAVAATCERTALVDGREGMVHFLESQFLVECLDRETGEPAASGADSEVVLTTLDREASPAIRFRMDDKVTFLAHSECRCGRPYAGYRAGSVGRWDDMMKVKGINVWPGVFDDIVMSVPDVAEYRGVVVNTEGRERCVIKVEFEATASLTSATVTERLDDIRRRVKAKTFITPDVEVSPDQLEKFILKPRRWTDLRNSRG